MKHLLMLAALAPCALHAQLGLYVLDGATETPLAPNSVFQLSPMQAGDTQTVQLRVRNMGSQPDTIALFAVDGAGFVLNRPQPPQTLAAGGFLNATLRFSAAAPANYSANLRLNGTSVLLLGTVIAGPVLTIPPECQGTAVSAIDFAFVPRGQTRTCTLSLRNDTTQAMTVTTLAVSGAGFALDPLNLPFTLLPGQSIPVGVRVTAGHPGVLSGTLRIQSRDYPLHAIATEAALPAPILEFDSGAFGSAQQRRLTLRLPEPSPFTGSGFVNLGFVPDGVTAADDPAVRFLESGTRQARFQVSAGQTSMTIEGAPSVTFQTGTTAGRLHFTLSGIASGFTAETTATIVVPPAPVALDKTLASRFPERLEVTLYGFDNTFSLGAMNFRFLDAAGATIANVPADFGAAFRAFFTAHPGGSMFKVTAMFPVSGGTGTISGVEVELANSAGTARTQRISF